MKFVYPAVFKKDSSGIIQVTFPDLDGCHAQGATMEDAVDQAKEAEIAWISLELEESFDLPPRTRMEDIVLEDGAVVQNVAATIRLSEGYDE